MHQTRHNIEENLRNEEFGKQLHSQMLFIGIEIYARDFMEIDSSEGNTLYY